MYIFKMVQNRFSKKANEPLTESLRQDYEQVLLGKMHRLPFCKEYALASVLVIRLFHWDTNFPLLIAAAILFLAVLRELSTLSLATTDTTLPEVETEKQLTV